MEALVVFTLCTCISMMVFILFNAYVEKQTNRLFLWGITITIILLPISCMEQSYAALPYFTLERAILSAWGYTLRPVIPFLIFLCLVKSTRRRGWIYGIPLLINGILCMLSVSYPLVFYFTEDNGFQRGPLNGSAFYTSFFYLLAIVVYSLVSYSNQRSGEIAICIGIVLELSIAILSYGRLFRCGKPGLVFYTGGYALLLYVPIYHAL